MHILISAITVFMIEILAKTPYTIYFLNWGIFHPWKFREVEGLNIMAGPIGPWSYGTFLIFLNFFYTFFSRPRNVKWWPVPLCHSPGGVSMLVVGVEERRLLGRRGRHRLHGTPEQMKNNEYLIHRSFIPEKISIFLWEWANCILHSG